MGYYPNDPLRIALQTITKNKGKNKRALRKERRIAWEVRADGRYLPKPKRDPLAPPCSYEPLVSGGAFESNRRRH